MVEEQGIDNLINEICNELKDGSYRPKPVKQIEIPKGDGKLILYADDFVAISKSYKDIKKVNVVLRYLMKLLGLTLNEEKTKIASL